MSFFNNKKEEKEEVKTLWYEDILNTYPIKKFYDLSNYKFNNNQGIILTSDDKIILITNNKYTIDNPFGNGHKGIFEIIFEDILAANFIVKTNTKINTFGVGSILPFGLGGALGSSTVTESIQSIGIEIITLDDVYESIFAYSNERMKIFKIINAYLSNKIANNKF